MRRHVEHGRSAFEMADRSKYQPARQHFTHYRRPYGVEIDHGQQAKSNRWPPDALPARRAVWFEHGPRTRHTNGFGYATEYRIRSKRNHVRRRIGFAENQQDPGHK